MPRTIAAPGESIYFENGLPPGLTEHDLFAEIPEADVTARVFDVVDCTEEYAVFEAINAAGDKVTYRTPHELCTIIPF